MSDTPSTAISVRGLGKSYNLDTGAPAMPPAGAIGSPWRDIWRRTRARLSTVARRARPGVFWALQDVSFDVGRGEVVGVVGRNGAGKSTLLRVLARVTPPSQGEVVIDGSVGSLLEVGTGFHPELSGRENVYLNGAILGMPRSTIARRFGAIVAFAEVEKFVDVPVKHYSSGMYMRLAFAVAAHLDAEILLVDEVLAVGDAAFQEKCLGSMQESARSGRTVLFVSHNLASIRQLCRRTVLLERGRLVTIGPTADVLQRYLSDAGDAASIALDDWLDRASTGEARLRSMQIGSSGGPGNSISVGDDLRIELEADFETAMLDPSFGVIVHSALGEPLLDLRSTHAGLRLGRVRGKVRVAMRVSGLGLYPGNYLLSPWISDAAARQDVDFVKLCATLHVHPGVGTHGDLRLDSVWGRYFVPSAWMAVGDRP